MGGLLFAYLQETSVVQKQNNMYNTWVNIMTVLSTDHNTVIVLT